MTTQVHSFASHQDSCASLAGDIAARIQAAPTPVVIALPGGTTPGPCIASLAGHPLNWQRVTMTLTDERWFTKDHPRANMGLLLRNLGEVADKAKLLALYRDGYTPAQAQVVVGREIQQLFAESTPLYCVLGMGEDGHFASLFPNNPNLEEGMTTHHRVLAVQHQGEDRLGLTLAAICQFAHIALLVTGTPKCRLLTEVLAGDHSQLPIARLLAACQPAIYQSSNG